MALVWEGDMVGFFACLDDLNTLPSIVVVFIDTVVLEEVFDFLILGGSPHLVPPGGCNA